MFDVTRALMYNIRIMIENLTTVITDAVNNGVDVLLPEVLDEFLALKADGVYDDIALSICGTHVATEFNLTAKQGQDVALHSLRKMGVEI